MDVRAVGQAGLAGWRAKVADAVAAPVSQRSGVDAEQVRAAVGALFFVLSVVYVVGTVRRAAAAR
ncbi:hypothetical protein [Modestobacter sp. NPDC049651]|uniref:hypothetical protein n=1 Tax=unclassified Modestobacter TaxID=2643866 RepID=UPI003411ECA0